MTHAKLQLSARYEYPSVPAADPPALGILLEIEALGDPLVRSGPAAHVILAIDVSASMNRPDKYPVLKEALGRMLHDLQYPGAPEVLLSVVIFSRGSELLLRGVPARQVDGEKLLMVMDGSTRRFGDYTDIPAALGRAGRIAHDQCRTNRLLPVRLYLLTDGRPQDAERSLEGAERLGRLRADVHALAFGGNADVLLLQQMFAGKRGGTVKSVRRETIGTAFERVAETARKVVATRCPVSVDLAAGVVGGDAFRYRPGRVRFPDPAFEGGKRFRADLGTIETGRTYSLLLEVRPPESEGPETALGTATAKIPGFGGPIARTLELSVPRHPGESRPGAVDAEVRTARDILGALTDDDPAAALRALRLRLRLYRQEKRDPGLLAVLGRAIHLLETTGSLEELSPGEYATLLAHTCTSGSESERF